MTVPSGILIGSCFAVVCFIGVRRGRHRKPPRYTMDRGSGGDEGMGVVEPFGSPHRAETKHGTANGPHCPDNADRGGPVPPRSGREHGGIKDNRILEYNNFLLLRFARDGRIPHASADRPADEPQNGASWPRARPDELPPETWEQGPDGEWGLPPVLAAMAHTTVQPECGTPLQVPPLRWPSAWLPGTRLGAAMPPRAIARSPVYI